MSDSPTDCPSIFVATFFIRRRSPGSKCKSSKRNTTNRSGIVVGDEPGAAGWAAFVDAGVYRRRSGVRASFSDWRSFRAGRAFLYGESSNRHRLVLIEQRKIFLREIADRTPVRIANHYRHQHRIHSDRNFEVAALSRSLAVGASRCIIRLLRIQCSDNTGAQRCAAT